MMYAYMIKGRKNAGKPNLFTWFDCKSDSRADREVMNILEDNSIETGRGADYQLPVRTDVPIYDDLPEEGVLDATWCDRYELAEDGRLWQKIGVAVPEIAESVRVKAEIVTTEVKSETVVTSPALSTTTDIEIPSNDKVSERLDEMRNLADEDIVDSHTLPFGTELAHFWLGGMFTATPAERIAANTALMNTDDSYLQNVILALNSIEACKHCHNHIRLSLLNNIKKIWPINGKVPALNLVLPFAKEWVNAINDATDRDGKHRADVVDKWLTKYTKERTPTGATAGGLNKTDRNPDMVHSLDTLDLEIALALMPFDFNIYDFEHAILRRAKEMVAAKESPWKEWSSKLRHCPGILDYSRAAIFALIRSARPDIHITPGSHQVWVNTNLTETNHAKPDAETLAKANRIAAPVSTPDSSNDSVSEHVQGDAINTTKEPEVKNLGDGKFSFDNLFTNKGPANEQMEATDSNEIAGSVEVSAGQGVDAVSEEAITVEESEPVAGFPAYFEPGRYEGLPNEVYHSANGISSTQVKDARISLMYFHGRHITKTIGRETSDALTFGTLVHSLALEPEAFESEFAVFPGVPAGAFTNTETLKTFIREYNEGKDKSEQLKLTGTKDVLSAAIRSVNPDAIFADEFEQQWREANQDKIILSAHQLAHAKAIQQALFNHPSAGQLLQHQNRANEVSYFGMDEETGLEVRVRPDLEIDMTGVRIGVDLKTISLGKVKQDFLRAKLHREIIERDYHLSAAMYCDVADFNQFFWIFVNKDEGYHWVAIIEASEELLELGRMEYRKAINSISHALDSDVWPAPITEDYTDELNDFDLRRLEALRLA